MLTSTPPHGGLHTGRASSLAHPTPGCDGVEEGERGGASGGGSVCTLSHNTAAAKYQYLCLKFQAEIHFELEFGFGVYIAPRQNIYEEEKKGRLRHT